MALAGKGGKPGGKGGKGGGKGRGVSIPQLAQRQARAQVGAAEVPIEQQIAAERAANLAKAQQQMGFAKAAAALMQSSAPAVQGAYTGAANADAGYARALGSGVQQNLDQNQSQDNSFLTQMGTPSGALHSAAPVGNVAYGLQGYIPASTLQREGAAWEAQAQLAPGNVLHAGQQQAAETLGNDPTLVTLQNDLTKLASTQPEVYQKLMTTFNEEAYKQASLKQGQERIGLEGQRLQLEAQKAVQSTRQGWARIGIENTRLQMEIAKQDLSARNGSLTPAESSRYTAIAQSWAQRILGTTTDPTTGKVEPQMTVRDAVTEALKSGVPLSIAVPQVIHTLKAAGVGDAELNQIRKQYGGLDKSLQKVAAKMGPLQKTLGALAFNTGAISGQAANTIVNLAHQYMGTPYVWGGESPKGFDCSGFAQFLYGKAGINIPRTTYTQWRAGRAVNPAQLRPGDLVFFRGSDSKGGLPGHVGIYIGNGQMIDAPHTGSDVRIEGVASFGGYMGARRYGKG